MAEAHSAVAFSFTVTPEGGVNLHVSHEALWAIWASGCRSWRKRVGRIRNSFLNSLYPISPFSLFVLMSLVIGFYRAHRDFSFGWVSTIQKNVPIIRSYEEPMSGYLASILFSFVTWFSVVLILRFSTRMLLSYHSWMYEPRGKPSLKTRLWGLILKLLVRKKPLLYSYQGALPKLPVPALKGTMTRYLQSVRPLLTDEKYSRMERLVQEFSDGIGPKLQRYLTLKSWWATNYVSDWWEEYVYLRGRSPIMINSNFYGLDALFHRPTTNQCARAASVTHAMLQFRRNVQYESLSPILLNKTIPLCSWQYDRQFNTTRIPGIETDHLYHLVDSDHIAVYHKGRYFKVYIRSRTLLLSPAQLQISFEKILADESPCYPGEEHLAALTAGDRIPWAKARKAYFSNGLNKAALDTIEKAAFVLVLHDGDLGYDRNNPDSLDTYAQSMLHGSGYDRWFDKSFTLVISSNGVMGFNAEHSWADAPIMGHLWEVVNSDIHEIGYRDDGTVKGDPEFPPPLPIRLQWDIPSQCEKVIESSLEVAQSLIQDVDLHLMVFDTYGKGFMKKCKTSPDAYIQMCLQLAYFRNAGKFCLTYEASMTRLFREGRTETVRSCTVESANFARAMDDKNKTNEQRIALLKKATETHQNGYRNAMTGLGIDRHLFCLYVVSKYLGIESPFLKEVLSEPWRLSTSQTPHQQTSRFDLSKNPELISAGGGFGPVADDGYGVSYIIAGEDVVFFHISSKKSSPVTDSKKFARTLQKALRDVRSLFEGSYEP